MKPSGWQRRNEIDCPMRLGAWLENARSAIRVIPEEPITSLYAILAHYLEKPAYWPQAHPEFDLTDDQIFQLDLQLRQLIEGKPLPYIIRKREFFGLEFYVTPEVLIPRPETEMMVEIALDDLAGHPQRQLIADVGTGSGCIAIALAYHHPSARILATDISFRSLTVAGKNCRTHQVQDRVFLLQSDLLSGVRTRFDLICANLPYIPSEKLASLEVARNEPRLALDGGKQGLELIARLLTQSVDCLNPGGMMLLEIEFSQAEAIRSLIHGIFPTAGITIVDDLNHLPRLTIIHK